MIRLSKFYKTMPVSQNPDNRLQEFREFLIDVADEIGLNKEKVEKYGLKKCKEVLEKISPNNCLFRKDSLGVLGYWEVKDF